MNGAKLRGKYSQENMISLVTRGATATPRTRAGSTSAIVVMVASTLSAVLGFAREVVSAHYYGTSAAMDAFLNASTIPLILFGIFNVALVNSLVPTFSAYVSEGRTEDLRTLGSTIINAVSLLMSGLAVIAWLLAPAFVPIFAHGFKPSEQLLVVQMVRWLIPGIIATSLSGIFAALLNAQHRFTSTAFVTVATNIVTIVLVIVLFHKLGIFALVLGSVIGLFAQLLVQLPSILRFRLYRFELNLKHPGVRNALALLIPISVGSGATQINLAFDRFFASTLPAGSTSGINYVTKLAFLPALLLSGAIGTVVFPMIARQFSNSDKAAIQNTVSLALRMIAFSVLPCAFGLAILAHPIIQTLFQRGAFGPNATALCAGLLPFACLSLVMNSFNSMLGRACYACQEVRLAVVGSIGAVIINVSLSASLLPSLGARGLLLANGAGGLFLFAFLIVVLRHLIGNFDWRNVLSSLLRVTIACCVMNLTLAWISSLGISAGSTLSSRAVNLIGLLLVGSAVFIGASRLLGVNELKIASRTILSRLLRPSRKAA